MGLTCRSRACLLSSISPAVAMAHFQAYCVQGYALSPTPSTTPAGFRSGAQRVYSDIGARIPAPTWRLAL
jgi:hypothetical protein